MANEDPETQARKLRDRLQDVAGRLSDPRVRGSVPSKAREELDELAGEASALATQSNASELLEVVAEVLYEKAALDFGFAQDSMWFVLHPQLERVAALGESSHRPRGLEVAAWAHLRMGECLVDWNDPQESPNDRKWGGRELHEAVRLGREAGSRDGLLHAALAGLLLAQVMLEDGNRDAAEGLRGGVCETRVQAHAVLHDEERVHFDSLLADALGEDPAGWCAKHARG